MQPSCCRGFTVAKILQNHKLEKEKNLYEVYVKQYGFASQGCLVVRRNDWGFCGVAGTPAASRGWGCVKVVSERKYWQPCMFKLKVHTYEVIQSIKRLIFGKYNTISGRGRRGRPRRVIPVVSERPAGPERDEHVVGSTTASMNQPPAAGQAGPSGPPEGAQVPGLFTVEQVAQIAQIVAIATRQQSQPPPPPREVIEEPGRSIERVQKLGAKPYDGSGDPEAAWLWLDRVNKVYGVMGCTDEQRVLFSSFLMEDRTKDWWDAVERRYPDGISWDQFQQEFTDRFFPQSHKDSNIEEFFRLEQKNMSVAEYEKRFSELVRLVPYLQADEVLKCKRFLSGLQHRIRVHLSVVPQNRFGDLVEAALRVEKSTTTMYQSRQESKRNAPGTSQQSFGHTTERKVRVEVTEAEVQVEELSLVRDQ